MRYSRPVCDLCNIVLSLHDLTSLAQLDVQPTDPTLIGSSTKEVAAELTTDSVPEVCLKERDRGRCDKFQQRYHYDHRKQECNIFFYGGCGGNENNFASEAECIRVCGRRAAAGGAANNNVSGQTPSVSNPSNQRSASASSEGGVTLPRVISLVEEVSVFDAATATNKLNSTKISEALLNHVKSTSKSQKSAAASEGSKKLPPSSRQRSKVPPTAAGGQRTFVENAPVLKENGSSFEFFGKLFETVPGNESSSSVELGNDFGKIDQSSFGENSKQSDEQLPLMPKDHFAGPVPTEAGQLNTSQTDQSEQSLLITQPIPLVETSQSNESIPPTEQVQTSPIKEQGDGVNQHLSVLQPTQHLNLQDQGRPIGNPLPLPPPTLGRPNVPPGQTANTPLCSPAPPACNPGCAISTDRFGCPVCFCAPLQAPRGAQVQKFQQLPRSCPFVSAETCPEPCLIIRERNGCQRCECHDPNGPLLAPQATPPALQQRNLQSGFGPLQPNRQQFPVQQAPQTNFPGSFQTSSFPSHSPVITSPLATSSTTNATFTVVNNTPATASVDTSETSQTNSGFTAITAGNDTTKLASPVFVSANATEQPVSPTVAAISSVSDEFEKCEQEKDPGPCTNFIIRYYFNATLKKCEEFQYGGCAGNRNHFYTLEQCLLHCERHFQTPSTTGTTVFRPEAAIREPVSVPQRPPQDQINLQVIPRVQNHTNRCCRCICGYRCIDRNVRPGQKYSSAGGAGWTCYIVLPGRPDGLFSANTGLHCTSIISTDS